MTAPEDAAGEDRRSALWDEVGMTAVERMCLDLRRDGYSYRQIADKLDKDVSTVHAAVKRGLRRIVSEPAEAVRSLELERLDKWLAKVMEIIETGSGAEALMAMDRGIRLVEARAKLLGLNAPVRVDARITDAVDAQIEALAGELSRLHERVDVNAE